MRFGIMVFIASIIVTAFGILMLIPAVVDFFYNSTATEAFLISSVITVFFGLLGVASSYSRWYSLSIKETFFVTSFVWLSTVVFSALPFYLWDMDRGFSSAFFEAMSGLTTTGATNFINLDTMPKGILLWRAMLQWIGGIGVIVIAIAILPLLSAGGMQLFLSESSDKLGEKASPRLSRVINIIGAIYLVLTLICALSLYLAGMNAFDAITHSFTCVSTGGFSTHDNSIAYFNSTLIEAVLIIFMVLGSLPFLSYFFLVTKRPERFTKDTQIRTFVFILVFSSLLVTLWIWLKDIEPDLLTALKNGIFNTISIVTTAGYVSADYQEWGTFVVMFFFFLIFIGGCSGSSASGIKVFRINILFLNIVRHLKQMVFPHGVFVMHYNGKNISEDIMNGIVVFLTILMIVIAIAALSLSALGIDFMTALTGVISTTLNVGSAFGKMIGPTGTYSDFPDVAKWVLSFCMMIGRLEFTTVTILFLPLMWKRG